MQNQVEQNNNVVMNINNGNVNQQQNNNINMENNQINTYQEGIFRNYMNMTELMRSKYKEALKLIIQNSKLFIFLFTLECLASIALMTLILIKNVDFQLFVTLIIIYLIKSFICFPRNYSSQSGTLLNQMKKQNGIQSFIFAVILTLLQLEFIILLRNFQIQLQEISVSKKNIQIIKSQYTYLIGYFSFSKLFVILKAYALLLYALIQQQNGNEDEIFFILIGFTCFSSIQYIAINHIYLQQFIFSTKQSILQQVITLVECIIQLISCYCYCSALVYNVTLRIIIFCIFIVYVTIIKCQISHQGVFNPLNIDIIQQIFMGQKLVYIVSLFNQDINQQDMIFHNIFNIIQFLIAHIYMIITYVFVLYYQTEYFPRWFVDIKITILIITLFTSGFKLLQMKQLYAESKQYKMQSISSLRNLNLKGKCKLVLNISYSLKEQDYQYIKNILNLDFQYIYIDFQQQFTIKSILGYSVLYIHNLDSACLKQAYELILSKSSCMNIKLFGIGQQNQNKQIISFLFSILKQTSIQDQKKIDLDNCDLVKYFENSSFFKDLKICLEQYNQTRILINIQAYYKHFSQYQQINSQMILYDLYEN